VANHVAIRRRSRFRLPGYAGTNSTMTLEDKVRRKALEVAKTGAGWFELDGVLCCRVSGGEYIEWVRANPAQIGRE
jgi:hypothetical protein